MARQKPSFRGSHVALVTPFENGAPSRAKIEELVEFQIANGTDGIVVCGTTGECSTLSPEEHREVVRWVREKAGARSRVIAGTGSNSTEEAVALTRDAKGLGADAVLVVCPYYNRPTQRGLVAHFHAVADATDLPLILYHVPSRTGTEIAVETAVLLSGHPRIVAIKESTSDLDRITRIAMETDLEILSGEDSLVLPAMALGAVGTISVIANVLPKEVRDLVHAALKGDWTEALLLHRRLFPLAKAAFLEPNPIPIKAAMRLLGWLNGEVRLPLVPIGPEAEEGIKDALRGLGLL
ncbi:MAG: 4-hydroxy-tetrahydrodipicolinate synthase [Planctomycetes bacterium]|nr:4-hydroxy-tetrahydrodipicolinate synthase [Planctomycetota bacterium]